MLLAGLVETKAQIWNHTKRRDINRIAYYGEYYSFPHYWRGSESVRMEDTSSF